MNIFSLIREQAQAQPGQLAYRQAGTPDAGLTYRDLVTASEAFAERLQGAGCQPGERCGLWGPDGPEFLVSALGILAAGLCIVPLGTFLPPAEVNLVVGAAGLQHLYAIPPGRLRTFPPPSAVDGEDDTRFRSLNPAYIRFTSGTTGSRKGVLLSHESMEKRISAADEALQIGPGDQVWFQLPMADHFVVSVLLYLTRGATVVSAPGHEPATWLQLIRACRPTIIYGSPAFYRQLAESSVGPLPGLRLAISTTSHLPHKVQRRFQERFGRPLNAALGIIEVGLLTLDRSASHPGSVGTVLPAYQATMVGPDGLPAPRGELGELHVNGPGLLDAYLAPWRPRAKLLGKFGFPTGDFGRLDAANNLYLAGRGHSRVEVDAFVFFAEEVEAVLNAFPEIHDSRVYLDPRSGLLTAEVVPEPGATLPQRLEPTLFLDPRLAPAVVTEVTALPRTPNGKLRRDGMV
ncbi:MAG TPA: class I adenylate-forming enzyme family protein [Chthoniobacterales bacterium]